MSFFISLVFLLVTFISLIIAMFFLERIITALLSHHSYSKKESLQWAKIVYESGLKQNPHKNYGADYFRGASTLINAVEDVGGLNLYRNKGRFTALWKADEKGILDLYVGIALPKGKPTETLSTFAKAIGAKAEFCSKPEIPTKFVSHAIRGNPLPGSVKKTLETLGETASSLEVCASSSLENSDRALIISGEMIRGSESKRYRDFIIQQLVVLKNTVVSNSYNSIETMFTGASRISMCATSDYSENSAKNFLDSALSGSDYTGWVTTSYKDRFGPNLSGKTGSILLTLLGLTQVAIAFLNMKNIYIYAPFILLTFVFSFLSHQGGKYYQKITKNSLQNSEIGLFKYFFFNPRWLIEGFFRSKKAQGKLNENEENKISLITAPPSPKDILTVNPAALTSMISFPLNSQNIKGSIKKLPLKSEFVDISYPVYWGEDGENNHISMDLNDCTFGMFACGAMGAGKTNLLQNTYVGLCKANELKMSPLKITPLWLELKGEGTEEVWDLIKDYKKSVKVNIHNPRSKFRLALEGKRISEGESVENVIKNISQLVSAMQFTWGGGIKASSRRLILNSLTIAMLLNEEEIKHLNLEKEGINSKKPNVLDLAYIILGGNETVFVGNSIIEIYHEFKKLIEINEIPKEDLKRVKKIIETIGNSFIFLDKKQNDRNKNVISPVFSKLESLRSANYLWTPRTGVKDFYISSIPGRFAPTLLNFGPYKSGKEEYTGVAEEIGKRSLQMAMYLLWQNINSNCSGWQKNNKRISIFIDEVSSVAVENPSEDVDDVLSNALMKGRSKGLGFFLGCQFPSQLPETFRKTVMSIGTKFWFRLDASEDINIAVQDISSGNRKSQNFSQENIREMAKYSCIGTVYREKSLGKVSPPFTLFPADVNKYSSFLKKEDNDIFETIAKYSDSILEERANRGLETGEILFR